MPCDPAYLDLILNAVFAIMIWEAGKMLVHGIMRALRSG